MGTQDHSQIVSRLLRLTRFAKPARSRRRLLVGFATCVALAIYLSTFVLRGWIAHDEGLLAQASERVLNGELPHVDFVDTYTGGLAYLNALAFRVFGVNLGAIRWLLFGLSLVFLPAVFFIAARRGTLSAAVLVTVTCLVWSLPNYFAALPSWHVLFLTTIGIVFLFRFTKSNGRWPLVAAGVCGGAAIVIKLTGLYFIAGAMLFLAFHEQERSRQAADTDGKRSWGMLVFTAGCTALFGLFVIRLLRSDLGLAVGVYFVAPLVTLCGFLVWNEWRFARGRFMERFPKLLNSGLVLLTGVSIPIVLFLVPYWLRGEMESLLHGVIELPMKRLDHAHWPLPPVFVGLLGILPLALSQWQVAAGPTQGSPGSGKVKFRIAMLALVLAGIFWWGQSFVFRFATLESLRWLMPWLVFAACRSIARLSPGGDPADASRRRQWIFLLAAQASACGLVQYPFSLPVYFFYCAPLVILTLHFVVAETGPRSRKPAYLLVLGFYAAFGCWHLNAGYAGMPDIVFNHRLEIPRAGGLVVDEGAAKLYSELHRLIQRHSPPGSYVYAAPDCPEVYFLGERKNPTRNFFDFFDEQPLSTEALLRLLAERDIRVVVVNREPGFSAKLAPATIAAIAGRFPQRMELGKFEVFCRGP